MVAVALSVACFSIAAALLSFSLFHAVCRRLTGKSSLNGNSNSSSESEVTDGILC